MSRPGLGQWTLPPVCLGAGLAFLAHPLVGFLCVLATGLALAATVLMTLRG